MHGGGWWSFDYFLYLIYFLVISSLNTSFGCVTRSRAIYLLALSTPRLFSYNSLQLDPNYTANPGLFTKRK